MSHPSNLILVDPRIRVQLDEWRWPNEADYNGAIERLLAIYEAYVAVTTKEKVA